jgi:hypothetical protein
MKENPWAKKHQKSAGLLAQKRAGKLVRSSPKTATSPSSGRSLADKARDHLYAVGWRPYMVGQPVSNEIHAALLKLAEANRKMTRAAMRRNARRS